MKLRLDFVHPRPRPSPVGWLLLLVGIAAASWGGWRYQNLSAVLSQERDRLSALVPASAKGPVLAAKRTEPASTEADQPAPRLLLGTDWGALFVALEESRPAGIAFLALDLDASRGGRISMTAEARDAPAMLAYVEALGGLPMLEQVALTSHADQDRNGEKAVRFSLKAQWRMRELRP